MPWSECKGGIIIHSPKISRQEWNEVLIRFGERKAGGASGEKVWILKGDAPRDVLEAFEQQKVAIHFSGLPTVDRGGRISIPGSITGMCETIPGTPTELACQPILNIFPDAARIDGEPELLYEGMNWTKPRPANYPDYCLINQRLKSRSLARYLSENGECGQKLVLVNVTWRYPPPHPNSRERYECLADVSRSWSDLVLQLRELEKRGVEVSIIRRS